MEHSQSSLCSLDIVEAQSGNLEDSLNLSYASLDATNAPGALDHDELSTSPLSDIRKETEQVDKAKTLMQAMLVINGLLFTIAAYFTQEDSTTGIVISVCVAAILALQMVVFVGYEKLVSRRHETVVVLATQSNTIIDSLFPSTVRDRLLKQADVSARGGSENCEDPVRKKQLFTNVPGISPPPSPEKGARRLLLRQDVRGKTALKQFLDNGTGQPQTPADPGQPICDLFENCTVLFIDIAGFTAWSADRDPPQVFCLLETLYGEFDSLAEKLKVFKVETIGDSYMAVSGLPEPNRHHATCMVRFAYQCVSKMKTVVDSLEAVLGPGTKDLDIRIGLHSGPVTAGVLRGDKARFQLFGDTVNTASRMESTGLRGKIQISQQTAELLVAAGKKRWISPRGKKIDAKGKGKLTTFWVVPGKKNSSFSEDSRHESFTSLGLDESSTSIALDGVCLDSDALHAGLEASGLLNNSFSAQSKSMDNSFRWMENSCASLQLDVIMDCSEEEEGSEVENPLTEQVQKKQPSPPRRLPPRRMPPKLSMVTASKRHLRLSSETRSTLEEKCNRLIDWNTDVLMNYLEAVMTYRCSANSRSVMDVDYTTEEASIPPAADLVADVISMPDLDLLAKRKLPPSASDLLKVKKELRIFVSEIAVCYNDIPFHNFEHASHVTLSANKLIQKMTQSDEKSTSELYEQSFGISSDPLSQFAMIFACLISNCGHVGVSNATLSEEKAPVAIRFKDKSITEQNAVAIGWQMLMEPRYQYLRSCIYRTNVERKRFRQVLINAVMATDVADLGMNDWRLNRWEKAFAQYNEEKPSRELLDRKATVVIESLVQMADVAHTMQHSNTYRRWNFRLYEEATNAYRCGRSSYPPESIWHQSELDRFDQITIPLAKRMKSAGVFGTGGAQSYLSNAEQNRNEWEQNGTATVSEFRTKLSSFDCVEEDEE